MVLPMKSGSDTIYAETLTFSYSRLLPGFHSVGISDESHVFARRDKVEFERRKVHSNDQWIAGRSSNEPLGRRCGRLCLPRVEGFAFLQNDAGGEGPRSVAGCRPFVVSWQEGLPEGADKCSGKSGNHLLQRGHEPLNEPIYDAAARGCFCPGGA